MEKERVRWRLRAARWRELAATCQDPVDRAAYENVAFEYERLAGESLHQAPSQPASDNPLADAGR